MENTQKIIIWVSLVLLIAIGLIFLNLKDNESIWSDNQTKSTQSTWSETKTESTQWASNLKESSSSAWKSENASNWNEKTITVAEDTLPRDDKPRVEGSWSIERESREKDHGRTKE